jgi:hypothetical protein
VALQIDLFRKWRDAKSPGAKTKALDEIVRRFAVKREVVEGELGQIDAAIANLESRERVNKAMVAEAMPDRVGIDSRMPTDQFLARVNEWAAKSDERDRVRTQLLGVIEGELELGDGRWALRVEQAKERGRPDDVRGPLAEDIKALEARAKKLEDEVKPMIALRDAHRRDGVRGWMDAMGAAGGQGGMPEIFQGLNPQLHGIFTAALAMNASKSNEEAGRLDARIGPRQAERDLILKAVAARKSLLVQLDKP